MTEVVAKPAEAPKPGTAEYDQAMAARFDAANGAEPVKAEVAQKPERPADVPEQFWNADKGEVNVTALLKSQAEAQRKITELASAAKKTVQSPAVSEPSAEEKAHATKATELATALAAVKAKQGATPEEIALAEKAVTDHTAAKPAPQPKTPQAKAVFDEFREAFRAGTAVDAEGNITEDFYKKFEGLGIDREMLDTHVAGQKAIAEARRTSILSKAQITEDDFKAIASWARQNVTEADAKALNEAFDNATPEAAALALATLKQRYVAANGQDPKLLGGKGGSSNTGFASISEQVTWQKDKRYGKDAAYMAEFNRKLEATTAY